MLVVKLAGHETSVGLLADLRSEVSMTWCLDLWHLNRRSRWTSSKSDVITCGSFDLVPAFDLFWIDAEFVR